MDAREVTRREFVRDTALAAGALAAGAATSRAEAADTTRILNYNPKMAYRRCGRTGLMVSAVALGGHYKQIAKALPEGFNPKGIWGVHPDDPALLRNRQEVIGRMIEAGINWIDACTVEEVKVHSRALKGRRDKMYLACSWYQREMRSMKDPSSKKLLDVLDWGLKDAGLEYADLWRITMHEQSQRHPNPHVDEMMKALETARKQGKIRFAGFSSHNRDHIKWMIETYPSVVDIVVTPCTPETKAAPTHSLFDTMKKHDVGYFGIKPFASGSMFKGRGVPFGPDAEEDNRIARLAIRKVLETPVLTAPIPGLITTQQVDNVARAVSEYKEGKGLSRAEQAELDAAMQVAWANLPPGYEWLAQWRCV